jgi:hypothetical protein
MRSRLSTLWPVATAGGGGPTHVAAALACACLLLVACQRAAPEKATAKDEPKAADVKTADSKSAAVKTEKEAASEGVTLTAEQVEKLGVETTPVAATDYVDEAAGFGVVLSHDAIAQAAAEIATERAAVHLSRSSLARAQKLAGTPGAVSADALDVAAQKAAVDEAALTLATQKLSSTLGMSPPWKGGEDDATLRSLAAGTVKLVRATFPLGAGITGTPKRLRAASLGTAEPGAGWALHPVWDAPADATVPGRSYFALLTAADAGEGERLQVWAPIGKSTAGFLIPSSAAVLNEAKYWCYVETKPGKYGRIEIDTTKPTAGGYFVTEGVTAGSKVVTAAAGQLLAKETGSSAEPE